ncbi:MAG TPA: peptidylprolyl isomerase [Gemmatimonadaceae bacterium]|nr:peptidylprolyl isomerase [Gemmatimonadaceae bacterium]
MKRSYFALLALLATITACDGFKEALTAHVDVVATAGSQELSVDRFANLLAQSKAPLNDDIANAIADLWVNYQLVAKAAAESDSLNAPEEIDQAMWFFVAQERAGKWREQVGRTWAIDSTVNDTRYAQGDLLSAQHILLPFRNDSVMSPAQRAELKQRAEALRARATAANFAQLARDNSADGSAQRGGSLGIFRRGDMVPAFEQAVIALSPGDISPVVETQFGYHIIRRPTLDEVREEFASAAARASLQKAESTYLARLDSINQVKFKDDAVRLIKEVARDVDAHRRDRTVIAELRGDDFTAARLVQWLTGAPRGEELQQGLARQADSADVMRFAKSVVTTELVLRQADSANVTLDSTERKALRDAFTRLVTSTWDGLQVAPQALADSAGAGLQRERAAASRVEQYMDRLMANPAQTRFVSIPGPLANMLRSKYEWKINAAGQKRAIERANRLRAQEDSTATANRPPSQVPVAPPVQLQGQPGQPPQTPPNTKEPAPAKSPGTP